MVEIPNVSKKDADKVAEAFGDSIPNVGYRKGEYILLDRESGDFCNNTLFFTPTAKGKGILVSPTVDGNIILGPTAEVIDEYSTKTTGDGLNDVIQKANKMCKNVPHFNTITSFCGVRAFSDKHDFIIEESKVASGLINLAGIESPGLTSAPAIAKHVAEELVAKIITLNKY
jgi:glycerol-3-phosphate dehydrogenase